MRSVLCDLCLRNWRGPSDRSCSDKYVDDDMKYHCMCGFFSDWEMALDMRIYDDILIFFDSKKCNDRIENQLLQMLLYTSQGT